MISLLVRSVPIVLAAGAAALAAAPASAIDHDGANSIAVRHGDLDLTTESGVGRLNRRIAIAARAVCGSFRPADLAAQPNVLACRKTTMAAAAAKVELAIAAARRSRQLAANAITVGNAVP